MNQRMNVARKGLEPPVGGLELGGGHPSLDDRERSAEVEDGVERMLGRILEDPARIVERRLDVVAAIDRRKDGLDRFSVEDPTAFPGMNHVAREIGIGPTLFQIHLTALVSLEPVLAEVELERCRMAKAPKRLAPDDARLDAVRGSSLRELVQLCDQLALLIKA